MRENMKRFIIQLSIELSMQVLGVDAWDLLDGVTVDSLVETIIWLLYLVEAIRGSQSISNSKVVEYYLEDR